MKQIKKGETNMSYQNRLDEYQQDKERDRMQEELDKYQNEGDAYADEGEVYDRVQAEAEMQLYYGLDDDHDLSNGFSDEDGAY